MRLSSLLVVSLFDSANKTCAIFLENVYRISYQHAKYIFKFACQMKFTQKYYFTEIQNFPPQAFSKAMDESINALGENDLNECFPDLKQVLGNSLQHSFINHIYKAEMAITTRFKDLAEELTVQQVSLSSSDPAETLMDPDDKIAAVAKDIKRKEIDWLDEDSQHVRQKLTKLSEQLTQVDLRRSELGSKCAQLIS